MTDLMLHLVTAYFSDDVIRAATWPGGYIPTARVLIQRERGAHRDRALKLALEVVSDAYADWTGELGFDIGIRDNTDAGRHAEALRVVREALCTAGMHARIRRGFVLVRFDSAREREIQALAAEYAEDVRLEALEKREREAVTPSCPTCVCASLAELLSGTEWTSGTLDEVARVLRAAGHKIADV